MHSCRDAAAAAEGSGQHRGVPAAAEPFAAQRMPPFFPQLQQLLAQRGRALQDLARSKELQGCGVTLEHCTTMQEVSAICGASNQLTRSC